MAGWANNNHAAFPMSNGAIHDLFAVNVGPQIPQLNSLAISGCPTDYKRGKGSVSGAPKP